MRTLRLTWLALAPLLSLIALMGCPGLPKGWPIPELKPPAGSTIKAVPEKTRQQRERLQAVAGLEQVIQTQPQWEVAFSTTGGWERAVSGVDSQLRAIGFEPWVSKDAVLIDKELPGRLGAAKLADLLHVYKKNGSPYTVTLLNMETFITNQGSIDTEGEFVLAIQQ